MILFLAAWFLRERITPAFIVLSMIAVAGMVVILYDPSASSGQLIGVALTLAGIVCCAVYSVVTRRWIPDAKETSQVVLSQQAHALVLAIGLVLVVGLAGGQVVPTQGDAAGPRQRDRFRRPLLRRRLLVLPGRPASRAGVVRGGVVLSDPGRRGGRGRPAPGRAPGPSSVGRRGHRPGGDPRDHSACPHRLPISRRPMRWRDRRSRAWRRLSAAPGCGSGCRPGRGWRSRGRRTAGPSAPGRPRRHRRRAARRWRRDPGWPC